MAEVSEETAREIARIEAEQYQAAWDFATDEGMRGEERQLFALHHMTDGISWEVE